jgi:hypothetical protein
LDLGVDLRGGKVVLDRKKVAGFGETEVGVSDPSSRLEFPVSVSSSLVASPVVPRVPASSFVADSSFSRLPFLDSSVSPYGFLVQAVA